MKLENDYKHMMDQVRPERELHVTDLENAKKKPGAGRYIAILTPAAAIILFALFMPKGLFGNKASVAPDTAEVMEIADSTLDVEKTSTVPEKTPDADVLEEIASAEEAVADHGTPEDAQPDETGGLLIVENKMDAVGSVRLDFETLRRDYETLPITEFMALYPETGEAYRKYYDMLYSTNPFFYAEMVYTWIEPGHPEAEEGNFLLVGVRIRNHYEGPFDSLNDEEHPDEGPDVSGYTFPEWSYLLGFLYRYDEAAGTMTRVNTPGIPGVQLFVCKDLTFQAETHEETYKLEDGTLCNGYGLMAYLNEDGTGYTVDLVWDRHIQTEIFFSVTPEGEVVIEKECVVMDSAHDYATDTYTESASQADRDAWDALMLAHGSMQSLTEGAEFLNWQVLDKGN